MPEELRQKPRRTGTIVHVQHEMYVLTSTVCQEQVRKTPRQDVCSAVNQEMLFSLQL